MLVNIIIIGNCKEKLKDIPDKSVRCCVTSPPYFGLRDYGTAIWVGGDVACDHKGKPMRTKENINRNTGTGDDVKNKEDNEFFKHSCDKCGAMRIDEQIGLEETPEQYIANLVEVFEAVKRKLTDDGTLWVNIGDSYAAGPKNRTDEQAARKSTLVGSKGAQVSCSKQQNKITGDLKPKDLIGIPWMLAFALRSAGWYLRQDIIWHKPNPMPESVTDRCTKAHEYIFLLSKSKNYYFDAEAIKQEGKNAPDDIRRMEQQSVRNKSNPDTLRNGLRPKNRGHARPHNGFNEKWDALNKEEQSINGANKRSVWTVVTKPYLEAHFATFPPELIIDCIKAGSAEGDIILDPFFGAGTTGLVAQKLNRNFIGIELNPKYVAIADRRLQKELGLFRKKNTEI